MEHTTLGRSNTQVSKICLGTMTWGEQNTEADAHEQLDYALSLGINFIDAAEMYPVPPMKQTQGLTERYIGTWLEKSGARKDVVLATKAAGPAAWLPHLRGGPRLSAEHLQLALSDSLERLKTDYVDLYQLHWPERKTNYFGQLGYTAEDDGDAIDLRETLSALKRMLDEGRIRHWGLSNETAWGVMKSVALAKELEMPAPVSIQNPYNLLNRSFEVSLAECAHREGVGLLAYSPLAFGVLSGKYRHGARPDGARLTLYQRFTRYTHEHAESAVEAYAALADRFNISLTHLALAFVNSRHFVTSNIIGATSMSQLKENIQSIEVSLGQEVNEALEEVHQRFTFPCP